MIMNHVMKLPSSKVSSSSYSYSPSSTTGYEVFLWGGPERREGEHEPVYAEGLGGVETCQLAFTTPLVDGNNATTTTANQNTASTATNQNNNNNNNDPSSSSSMMVTDPRHRAVALVLTKDHQVKEWGPCPNWSAVDHKSRQLANFYNNNNNDDDDDDHFHSRNNKKHLRNHPDNDNSDSTAPNPTAIANHNGVTGGSTTTTTTSALPGLMTTTTTTTTTSSSSSSSSLSVIQIATGLDHYAAVTTAGHLYTWGSSAHGKLGHNHHLARSSSHHRNHQNNNNHVNAQQQPQASLFSSATDVVVPKRVETLWDLSLQIQQVSCGDSHTLALTTTGQVYSWGKRDIAGHVDDDDNNDNGNDPVILAMNNHNNQNNPSASSASSNSSNSTSEALQLLPRRLAALEGQVIGQIAARAKHSAALTANGHALYTWGKDNHGQLGHGNKRPCFVPTLVQALSHSTATTARNQPQEQQQQDQDSPPPLLVQVSCGTYHMAVLNDHGQLYTFGNNKGGQLGTGDKEEKCVPHLVEFFETTTTTTNTLSKRRTKGTIKSKYKANESLSSSSLSFLRPSSSPPGVHHFKNNNNPKKNVPNDDDTNNQNNKKSKKRHFVTQVGCGKYHTIVLTRKGDVFTWGYGYNGQLGHGSYYESMVPQPVEKLQQGYHVEQVGADGLYSWAMILPSSLAADDISFTSSLRSMVNNPEFADVEFEFVMVDDDYDTEEDEDDEETNENNPEEGVAVDNIDTHDSESNQAKHRSRRRRSGGGDVVVERVFAHRVILIQRSHFFRAMFRSGMRESTERVIRMSSDMIRKPIFLLLLEYMYTDTVVTVPVEAAFELWEVAEMHGLKQLQCLCCQSVERNITVDNAAVLLQMAAAAAGTTHTNTTAARRRRTTTNHRCNHSSTTTTHCRWRKNVDNPGTISGNRVSHLEEEEEDYDNDDDYDEYDNENHPKNRLQEICMSFVVDHFAQVSQTEGLQQITNTALCHEIMMEIAAAYCS